MKLYVESRINPGNLIHIQTKSQTVDEFYREIGSQNTFYLIGNENEGTYNISEVKAQTSTKNSVGAAIIGASLGLLGGGIGALLGLVSGSLVGSKLDQNEEERVFNFNREAKHYNKD